MTVLEDYEKSGVGPSYPRSASFAELVSWHLTFGTRPNGGPDAPGLRWSNKEFAEAVFSNTVDPESGARVVRNWRAGRHRPQNLGSVERALFGESAAYSRWRLDLRTAYEQRSPAADMPAARAGFAEGVARLEPARGPETRLFAIQGGRALAEPDAAPDTRVEPTAQNAAVASFEDRPVIAVLPFRAQGLPAEHRHVADGLTDELIGLISAWRTFPVIARNSVFAQNRDAADIREVGARLGARYIVSGALRWRDAEMRVRAQLIDVSSGTILMSDNFSRNNDDPGQLQDDIALAIAGVLAPEIHKLEYERAGSRYQANASAYDMVWRAQWLRHRTTRDNLATADALYFGALQREPGYARALTGLALNRNVEAIHRWTDDVLGAFRESLDYARAAVVADPRDPQAHFALGIGCMNMALREEAVAQFLETIRLNPSHVGARANLGQMYNYLDQPARALPEVELALSLSPHDPVRYQWLPYVATSHYLAGRYEDCLAACGQALALNGDYPLAIRYKIAAMGQLGLEDAARALLPAVGGFDGAFADVEATFRRLFVPSAAEHILDGFRLAGLDRWEPSD